jgi:purine-binding chemotaxis protein CheW
MDVGDVDQMPQYLSFYLENEVFAFGISSVREVLELTKITKVPRTPEFMRGVINLRGSVVPVVDLRLKLGMPEAEHTLDTCIVIVEIELDKELLVVGMLVDSVQEVAEIGPEDIDPAPSLGTNIKADFLNGMGKRQDEFVMILDIDRVLSTADLAIASQLGDEGSQFPNVESCQ